MVTMVEGVGDKGWENKKEGKKKEWKEGGENGGRKEWEKKKNCEVIHTKFHNLYSYDFICL